MSNEEQTITISKEEAEAHSIPPLIWWPETVTFVEAECCIPIKKIIFEATNQYALKVDGKWAIFDTPSKAEAPPGLGCPCCQHPYNCGHLTTSGLCDQDAKVCNSQAHR
jgi:hypothetical protein